MNDAFRPDRLPSHSPLSSERDEPASLTAALAPLRAAKAMDRPMVIAQLGQSLDGRIATPTGSSRGINGPAAIAHLHRLRALVDAVVVGAGTARTDNPRLTVRDCAGESPARVVIDPRGTVCPASQVWCPADGKRRLAFGGSDGLAPCVERIAASGELLDPEWIVNQLQEQGFSRVLIEGGGKTVSHFLETGAVDQLHVLVAPIVLGSGLTGLSLPEISEVAEAPRPPAKVHVFDGGDVLFACDLR